MTSLAVLKLFRPYELTLSSFLEARARVKPQSPCLLVPDQTPLNWKEFHDWVGGLSAHLKSLGIKKGDRVVVVGQNSDFHVALFFALAGLGAIFVPFNPQLNSADSEFLLNNSEPSIAFVENSDLEKKLKSFCKVRIFRLDASLHNLRAPVLIEEGKPSDCALILYTSGTTGFPKGVMHNQQAAVQAGEAFVERMALTPKDRVLCILPFFHINALFYSLMGCFASGGVLIIPPKFSASRFWDLVKTTEATQVNIIAAVGNILRQRPRDEFVENHKLNRIYAAPLSPEVEQVFQTDFKVPRLIEGYGMTEIPGVINNQLSGKNKLGTMGVAALIPRDEALDVFSKLRIVDDYGNDVPAGKTGELWVQSELMFMGYFRSTEHPPNEWFRTGDLVFQDPDGFYVFVSRKKDIIRCRGENISGAEVDRAALQINGVIQAAAIGVPSPLGEEDILLVVVAQKNKKLSCTEIRDECEKILSKTKWPRFVALVDELPLTPTSRVAKFKLKEKTSDLLKIAEDFG